MKRLLIFLLILIIITDKCQAQEKISQFGFYSFFDNVEFGQSTYKKPQTISGFIASPSFRVQWDTVHNLTGGIDLLREFGSKNHIDNIFLTAYYKYDKMPFMFIMGAFPRNYALHEYPRIFFQDSVTYYRPNINGILWEYNVQQLQANVWLDWTGRQDREVNEAFLLGLSGRYNKNIFYIKYFTYLNHFASKLYPIISESLHDNAMLLASAGIDLSEKTFFNRFELNAGWVLGLDRSRSEHTGWFRQNGLLSEFNIEYLKIGLFNSFYCGDGQMHFYYKHANKLYWGDPIYQADIYNRSDLYISFLNNKFINAKVTYSLHFAEGRIYHEQLLKLSVNVNR